MKRIVMSVLVCFGALAATVAAAQTTAATLLEPATPLKIDANRLVIEMQAQPPKDYPHVGHRAPVTFEQAINTWANSRFELTGAGENTLRVTVREADIVEKVLPVKKGIMGWFRKDQSAEYTANLDVVVSVVDANNQQLGQAEARSMFATTIEEGTTDAEKQDVWQDMVKRLLGNVDRELQSRIRQVMTGYVQ